MIIPLQVACVVLVSLGIGVELWFGAELGFLLISIGGASFGVATKIHALEIQNERSRENERKTSVGIHRECIPRISPRSSNRLRRKNRQ